MLGWLHDWQELASGLLALLAGAFIFIQGRLEIKSFKQIRYEELEQEARRTEIILERLKQAATALAEEIDSYLELLGDVLDALDRGEDQVELPPKVLVPRVFEIIFAQLTTREVPIEIYLQLSALIERGIAIDEDFRRLIVAYSGTVTEHRPVQPRLPLAEGQARRASEEPAAQGVIVSVTALQEVAGELVGLIDSHFGGDRVNVGNVRESVQHLEQM